MFPFGLSGSIHLTNKDDADRGTTDTFRGLLGAVDQTDNKNDRLSVSVTKVEPKKVSPYLLCYARCMLKAATTILVYMANFNKSPPVFERIVWKGLMTVLSRKRTRPLALCSQDFNATYYHNAKCRQRDTIYIPDKVVCVWGHKNCFSSN